LDPEPGGESTRGAEEPLPDDSLREFLELGTSRHGYRERILTVYGAGLAAALEFVAANPRSISTLIILRPGDAWSDRRAIQATVASLPNELRILWVSSGRGYESGRAARLRYTVERQLPPDSLQALNLPPLAAGRKAFELRLSETLLYELLQERLELEWLPANEVFAGGCGVYASGGGRLRLGATLVSAGRDYDFCPLFVRRTGQALFRAEAVGDERCTYRQADGRRRIYCAY
jgi:hypothetical protein